MSKFSSEGLAFDDVLIVPVFSDIEPSGVDTSIHLTDHIKLKIPFMSAGMDTVTESQMAIAMARCGGIGIIHRLMPIAAQATEVDRVKRSEHGVISDPFYLSPNHYVYEADKLMGKYRISGVPIVDHDKLVGIITNRDLRFEPDYSKKIYEVMTKDNLITAPVGTTINEAKEILTKHKIEKLPLVDEDMNLKGLITIKDINKTIKYPMSAKDDQSRLLVGAAVAIGDDLMERVSALAKVKVDVLSLEILQGRAGEVIDAIAAIKELYPHIALIVGNVATPEATESLIKAGADAIKIGLGPSSVSTKRIIAGIGVPQITAIETCYQVAKKHNIPIIADGGIRFSGDITKALAAGASICMMGNLFAGCEESPGTTELFQGRKYKVYRGVESLGYEASEIHWHDMPPDQPHALNIPRGVEGRITYKGKVSDVLSQLLGGLVLGMSYTGCANIHKLHKNAKLMKVTPAGLQESHPHGVQITRESPNYNF